MSTDDGRLSTREVAARLGVKPETVYAYVSRGLLGSRRGPGGRGSTFDPGEVDALVRRGRRGRPAGEDPSGRGQVQDRDRGSGEGRGEGPVAGGIAPIRTAITSIGRDGYHFRGVDPLALAERYGYEEVAQWLWTGVIEPGVRFTAPKDVTAAARRAIEALPAHGGLMDRLRTAAVVAAAADPLRFDLAEENVIATARSLIATLVDALAAPGGAGGDDQAEAGTEDAPLARRLWARLTPPAERGAGAGAGAGAAEPWLRCLDAALVLLVDHDLAASTLAVRVAASARAHPYAVVSAGLGALDGPLHGAASGLAHRMLTEVLERGSAAAVVSDHLRSGRRVPGLGHRLYPGADPRARMLFALLEDVPEAGPALAAAREVEETTARHAPLHANVDLALAVLSVSAGMPVEAGEAVFSVARTAGWIAHALEEYRERPLRLRPSGIYTGPRPPQPLP